MVASSHLQARGVDVNTGKSSRCFDGYTFGSAAPYFRGLKMGVPGVPAPAAALLVPLKQLANYFRK